MCRIAWKLGISELEVSETSELGNFGTWELPSLFSGLAFIFHNNDLIHGALDFVWRDCSILLAYSHCSLSKRMNTFDCLTSNSVGKVVFKSIYADN